MRRGEDRRRRRCTSEHMLATLVRLNLIWYRSHKPRQCTNHATSCATSIHAFRLQCIRRSLLQRTFNPSVLHLTNSRARRCTWCTAGSIVPRSKSMSTTITASAHVFIVAPIMHGCARRNATSPASSAAIDDHELGEHEERQLLHAMRLSIAVFTRGRESALRARRARHEERRSRLTPKRRNAHSFTSNKGMVRAGRDHLRRPQRRTRIKA